MQQNDEEIIVQIREQRRKGFDLLLENYGDLLYGAAMRMTGGSAEAASEIFKETLTKIWKNARNYNESKGVLFTWMINILRNQAFEYLRAKGMLQQLRLQSAEDYLLNHAEPPTSGKYFTVKEFMSLMRPDQLELMDMIYFKGMSYEEAARQLRFPSGTVKTRIRAVLSHFRKFLTIQS